MKRDMTSIFRGLASCAVFRGVLQTELFERFGNYVYTKECGEIERIDAYADFVAALYKGGGNLTEMVKKIVFEDENVYIKGTALKKTLDENILRSAKRELEILSVFASLTVKDFALDMDVAAVELPAFSSFNADMGALYAERLQNVDKYGYGIFSANVMFRLTDEREIEGIASADQIQLSQFVGYEEERAKVVDNTRAFIEGRPAANTLLCGDAGAGKSSTVKAVANAFFNEGVRLIELRKDQLRYLPEVMAKINGNPLKFIIFIDDLSFNQNDDNFSMLKAALEGSASAMADNAVIYATSNRRHIIKESFSDRDGDDVHRNDTLQETLSLSERFGLTVLFSKPNKQLYLNIVKELAKRFEITIDEKDLEVQAEAFALRKGNRSARAAEQFINSLR
ncbi:MAG: ATP-binding protein [Clostridiales bacterium]|nr:ATP-binding protein [Clostridiales bacterium]